MCIETLAILFLEQVGKTNSSSINSQVLLLSDLNFLSVLEYAVDSLQVPHIIVCGHYDCGAVRGSISRPDKGGLGLIENWLRNIRDVARLHKDELKVRT